MQAEKQRERLVELIKKSRREWLEKEYDNETEKTVDEYIAHYLIANGVTVEQKGYGMKQLVFSLLEFAKSINSERVELQKDEYLWLLDYMEKTDKILGDMGNESSID